MISSLKEEVKSLRGKTICSDREISSLKDEVARSDCENIRFRAEHPASDREMSSLWGKVQDLKQEVCNVTNALGQLQLVMSSLMPVQRHKLLESATKKTSLISPARIGIHRCHGKPYDIFTGICKANSCATICHRTRSISLLTTVPFKMKVTWQLTMPQRATFGWPSRWTHTSPLMTTREPYMRIYSHLSTSNHFISTLRIDPIFSHCVIKLFHLFEKRCHW